MKILLQNKKDIYVFTLIVFTKTLLDIYYVIYITNIWGYQGFKLLIMPFRVFISYILLSIFYILAISIKKRNDTIYFVYILLLIFYFIPNLTFFGYANADIRIVLGLMIFLFSISFSVYFKFNLSSLSLNLNSQKILICILLIASFLFFFLHYKFNVFPKVLLLQDIYEARTSFNTNTTILHNYTFGWFVKIIAPISLIWGLINKQRFVVILAIISLLYLYLLSGHKSVFLTLFIMFFVYKVKGSITYKTNLTIIGVLALIIIVPFLDMPTNHNLFKGIFINRLFFIPSLLNECYFDFFDHNYMKLSHSVFSIFFEYPYDLEPANKIGLEYFNRAKMMANNGVVSDAFMNFGFIGIIMFSLLIFVFFTYINSLDIDASYLGIFVIFSRLFVSSPFLTFFLTHGALLFMILAPLIMKKTKK